MTTSKTASRATANIQENRLYISLTGVIQKNEVEKLYTDIRFCTADLTPGFSVITDLTNCRIGYLSAIQSARKIMKFLIDMKVGQVVRIVGPSRIIFLQISRLIDGIQNYEPIYVKNMDEAKSVLESLEREAAA